MPPPMARCLLSRARLIKLDRPILPPALTRLLSRGPPTPTTSEPEDKGKKAAAAAAVLVEAAATNRREDAEVGRDGSEEDDEEAGLPWRSWRPDVAWLSKALEPALDLYKQYSWKPFACLSLPLQLLFYSNILSLHLSCLIIVILPSDAFLILRIATLVI